MPIQVNNVTHNNNGHFYRIAIDIAKEGSEVWDLTPYFKGRVGDDNFGLQIVWYYQGQLLDVTGKTPYIKGNVGHYSFDDQKNLQLAPDADVVVSHGDPNDCQANGQATYYFPQQMFMTDGVFKGFIGLQDDNQNLTGVDIWFRVLPGVANMGKACDFYVDILDKTIADFKEKIRQQSIDFDTALQQELQNEKNLIQQKLDAASGAMDESTAALGNLAASVGHIQSLINAGDVVSQSEYQKDKEETDTQVGANTRELQSHDAQLKQLTASPSSDGTTEIADARIGSSELSSKTYSTLGDAIRSQVGGLTDAMKATLHEQPILPYNWVDNTVYNKDQKASSTSGSLFFFNVYELPLVRIRTSAGPYFNFYTLLDSKGNVVDYQRNDDSKAAATVDITVAIPNNVYTLVVSGAPGKGSSAKVHVTTYGMKWEDGKVYQGSFSPDDLDSYIENGMASANICVDTSHCEAIITVDDTYQIWDNHLQQWTNEILVQQNDDLNFISTKRTDGAYFSATDVYNHFKVAKSPIKPLVLKSTKNGLSDISDRFKLQYNTILTDSKSNTCFYYGKNIALGMRIATQFITVDRPQSWLIDCDDGYKADLMTAKPDGNGNYLQYDFYNGAQLFQTPLGFKGGHDYVNVYPQGAYALVFGASDDKSKITIADLWDHVRVYQVDNLVHLPSYYVGHIKDRVATINEKLTSPDDFGFGFITDVHAEFNTKHFPALIDEVRTKTPVNEFLGGGDWATAWFASNNDADQKPELFSFFEELRRLFKGVPLLKTVGNHEWAYGANNSYNITSQEMYAYYLRDEDKMFSNIQWGPDHTYYYWDNQQAKCRYISLNVMDYPDTVKPTGNADNKEWYFKVSDTQINWLKATLNSVPDGYVVAIESHLVPLNADQFASFPAAKIGTTITNGEDLQAIASAYAAKTGDFASAKGELLGWFGGHYHADDITVRNGVTYITTIADCMSVWDIPGAPKKTVGTISEQAFDVATVDRATRKVSLIRIGDGVDRSFTY